MVVDNWQGGCNTSGVNNELKLGKCYKKDKADKVITILSTIKAKNKQIMNKVKCSLNLCSQINTNNIDTLRYL